MILQVGLSITWWLAARLLMIIATKKHMRLLWIAGSGADGVAVLNSLSWNLHPIRWSVLFRLSWLAYCCPDWDTCTHSTGFTNLARQDRRTNMTLKFLKPNVRALLWGHAAIPTVWAAPAPEKLADFAHSAGIQTTGKLPCITTCHFPLLSMPEVSCLCRLRVFNARRNRTPRIGDAPPIVRHGATH